jgi:hypothetical protein
VSPNVVAGGARRSFESLRDAVRLVMETLQEPFRSTAFIASDAVHHDFKEIGGIYVSDDYKNFQT